jgi:hypothetical protein
MCTDIGRRGGILIPDNTLLLICYAIAHAWIAHPPSSPALVRIKDLGDLTLAMIAQPASEDIEGTVAVTPTAFDFNGQGTDGPPFGTKTEVLNFAAELAGSFRDRLN